MTIGTCGLCRLTGPLRNSHLIPAAFYRLVRAENALDGVGPDPVLLSPTGTVQTSQQIRMSFLCAACEDRFSKFGERLVAAECLRPLGQFVLRDKLRHARPRHGRGVEAWFSAADLSTIDIPAYRYFAASMFWRASAGDWPTVDDHQPRGTLGAEYKAAFAEFLLRRAEFPQDAKLVLFVANDLDPISLSSVPVLSKDEGFDIVSFFAPGIEFRMFLGKSIARSALTLFHLWQTDMLFVLHDSHQARSTDRVADIVRQSTLRGRLARERRTGYA